MESKHTTNLVNYKRQVTEAATVSERGVCLGTAAQREAAAGMGSILLVSGQVQQPTFAHCILKQGN